MKSVYSIGRFQFDSYAEYKKAVADVKKIKCISDELDVREPGVALRLYTLIRQEKILFQSVIGEDYLLYLSDLVADDYKELSDGNDVYLANLGRKRSPRRFAGVLCIVIAFLCFSYFLGSEYMDYRKTREVKELQESREVSKAAQYIADRINKRLNGEEPEENQVPNVEYASPAENQEQEQTQVQSEVPEPSILPEYVDLHAKNSDLAGWIEIPGTEISYPVMQTKEDNEFYLKHNFDKQEDKNGSIFMDMRNDFKNRDTNLIIYGHNMKSGLMFGSLKQYIDETYWQDHKIIEFNTLYEQAKYDIIAVCPSEVAYQDDDVFRYYDFINAENEEEFEVYKQNIAQMNVFGEDLDISYGDELITLSTCSSYVEDGRLFLVAKRVESSQAGQ